MSKEAFETPRKVYNDDNYFRRNEVGVTHPDTSSFIRLNDNGNIEIAAGDEVAIILNPKAGTITMNADTIRFRTSSFGGLRWNRLIFNDRATGFSEPTFVTMEDDLDIRNNYAGASYFTDGEPQYDIYKMENPRGGEPISIEDYARMLSSQESFEEDQSETNTSDSPNNIRGV